MKTRCGLVTGIRMLSFSMAPKVNDFRSFYVPMSLNEWDIYASTRSTNTVYFPGKSNKFKPVALKESPTPREITGMSHGAQTSYTATMSHGLFV